MIMMNIFEKRKFPIEVTVFGIEIADNDEHL
jgi:hypothetical protein